MTGGTITKTDRLGNDMRFFCYFKTEGVSNTVHQRQAFAAQKFIVPKGYLQHKLIKESQFSSDKHGNIDFIRLRRLEALMEERRGSNFPQLSTLLRN